MIAQIVKTAFEASPHAEDVLAICRHIRAVGGRAMLVGGSVRDALQKIPPKDLDLEVYELEQDSLIAVLSRRHVVDLVGKSFGVLKLHHLPVDISLPRREEKSGTGHKGFDIQTDPWLSPAEAAKRRDFTINAISYDPLENTLYDPCNGITDLENATLRHTSPKFVEDPLRVLRGMQFAARFDMQVAPETVALCRTLGLEGLSSERIFDEWVKLIVKGVKPSRGLNFIKDCGWVRFFPELESLIGCQQDPEWHPEGDVWIHTLHCLDAFAAQRTGDEYEDLVVGLAVLCHDLGKPLTTVFERGRLRSPGHEEAGAEPTRTFLRRMTARTDLIKDVVSLVIHHLRPHMLFTARSGDNAIRRLARNTRIDRLVRVSRADMAGRPPTPFCGDPAGDWLLARAEELQIADSAPKPIVLGRHLIPLGYEPGPNLGRILNACYEAQLDGLFNNLEDGIAFAIQYKDGN